MTISRRTRVNWVLDAAVFISALSAGLSGIYFLGFPSGGFQGGRNLLYGTTILFDRQMWSDMHTWGSVALIIAITIHLAYHWNWVKSISRKLFNSFSQSRTGMSRGGKVNMLVNLAIGISFLLTALTGIYFLFTPSGGYQGGANPMWDPGFLFSRTMWDAIHTWAGVAMIVAAMFHFIIHWRWIKNVTGGFFGPLINPSAGKHQRRPDVEGSQI